MLGFFWLKYEFEILVMTAQVQSIGLRMTKDMTFYDMAHILAQFLWSAFPVSITVVNDILSQLQSQLHSILRHDKRCHHLSINYRGKDIKLIAKQNGKRISIIFRAKHNANKLKKTR